VLGGVSVGIVTTAAEAASSTSAYAQESFAGAAVVDAYAYKKLMPPTNQANSAGLPCLTAGSDTAQTPIQGCASPAVDASNGALRLTTTGGNQASGVGATSAIPITQGLDAAFDSAQYGGSGADGIAFYLVATDPYNPAPPTITGSVGGSLGYSNDRSSGKDTVGITDGYLGLGLDAYGNFQGTNYGGSNCTGTINQSTALKPSVTVRGPGTGKTGYCVLATQAVSSAAALTTSKTNNGTRANSEVPVEVVVNTSATQTITSAGFTTKSGKTIAGVAVAPRTFAIVYRPINGAQATPVSGPLPTVATTDPTYHAGWFDKDGYPYKLTYGWVSSTGGSNDYHEVNQFTATSLSGRTPVLDAGAPATTPIVTGQSGTFTQTPTVTTAGGDELGPVRTTTVFPSGTTPTANGTVGAYSCTTTGQQVVCSYDNASGTKAGTALPTLSIPFTTTVAPGTSGLAIASTVASTDAADPARSSTTVDVRKTTTATTLTSTRNPSTFGDAVTLTATVDDTSATGTVVFRDGTTTLCTASLASDGTATCPANSLTAGNHSVVATYGGDTTHGSSASAALVQVVGQRTPSGLALTASPAGVAYGTSSTLTATLPADASAATGTVTFTGDDGSRRTATVQGGVASVRTDPAAEVGTITYTARYEGDTNHGTVASNSAPVQTSPAATSLSITADGQSTTDHVAYGTGARFASTGLPSGATGTVTYTGADGATICTTDAADAAATCANSGLAAGTYRVSATYGGDTHYAPATSNTVTLVVDKAAAPTLVASADPSPSTYGAPVTLGASGLPTDGATGTITWTIDGATACTATLPTTTCAPSTAPTAGSHTLVASWSGDADHEGATSASVTMTVARSTVAIGATVDGAAADTVSYGTPATLAATGIPADAAPDSRVSFTGTAADGSTVALGSATAGHPTVATAADLAAGQYTVTATWAGDANHAAATSDSVTLTVTPAVTHVAAAVDGKPAQSIQRGNTATLTASGLPTGATGTVQYRLPDGTVLGTGSLPAAGVDSSATASAPVTTSSTMRVGTYQVVAVYSGDADHAGSTSDTVQLVVARRSVVLTDTVDGTTTASSSYGTPVLFQAWALPDGATGTLEFRDQRGILLCSVQLPDTSCSSGTAVSVGTWSVIATYLGDSQNAPVTTVAPASWTVTKARGSVELGSATGGSGTGGSGTSGTGGSGGTGGTGGTGSDADVVTAFGTPVTLTPGGLPAGATGTVTFTTADGTVLCTVDLGAGQTSCVTPATQAPGTLTVTPTWSGDADHEAATGTPFTLRVLPLRTAIAVAAGPSMTWGQPTLLTISGLPSEATGTVALHVGSTPLCTITLPGNSCTTAAIEPGVVTVTADYAGDAAHAPSSASTPVRVLAIHTMVPEPARSSGRTSLLATWPAVPGTARYVLTVATSADMSGARAFDAAADRTSLTVDGLADGTTYFYRVQAIADDGVLLSAHDAAATTAVAAAATAPAATGTPAAPVTATGRLAFTGSSIAVGMVVAGGLLLLVAGMLLVFAERLRAAEQAAPGPRRGLA
jgi:hypothetical protein